MALGWAARLAIVWCLLALLGDVLSQAQAQESDNVGGSVGGHPGDPGRGQPADRGGDHSKLHDGRSGRAVRPGQAGPVAQEPVRHGPVRRRRDPTRGRRHRGQPGREPDHQPHRLRGQSAARRRRADLGGAVAAARRLHPLAGAERGQPDPRAVSPQRPVRRHGRAQGDPAAAEPGRPGVRDQRGPAHRDRAASCSSATRRSTTASCAA